jgi:O-antigen/teichoic acid export membrane protein
VSSAKNILYNLGAKVLLYPLTFIVSIIISRTLGPADKGVLAFVLTVTSFCTLLLTFGMGMGFQYQIGSKKYSVAEVIGSALIWAIVNGLIINGGLGLLYLSGLMPIFSHLTFVQLGQIFVIVQCGILQMIMSKMLVADDQFFQPNAINVGLGLAQPIFLLILVWYWRMGISGVLITSAILAIIGAFVFVKVMIKKYGSISWSFRKDIIKDSWHYGIKSWLGDVTQVANLRLDQIILGFFVPTFQLGLYTVAVTLVELLWIIPDGVNGVLLNQMMAPQKSLSEKFDIAGKVQRLLFLGISMIALFLFLAVKFVILPFGYGEVFASAIVPFIWLIPGAISMIIAKGLSKILTGTGYVQDTTHGIIIGSIVNLILYFASIPKWGVVGAAIASSFGYMAISLAMMYFCHRRFPLEFNKLFHWSKSDLNWGKDQFQIIRNMIKVST